MTDRSQTTSPAGPEAKLLVVEDEPNIRELLSARCGSPASSRDGRRRRERARPGQSEQPDLLVLDVMLPDIDGFAVIRRLREQGRARAGRVPHRPGRHRRQDHRA